MRLNRFLTLQAILAVVFGIGDGLIPATSASWFGLKLDAAGVFMAQSFAAMFFGMGLVCWFVRRSEDFVLRQRILLAFFTACSGVFLAASLAQLSGLMNLLGWFVVAIWLFQALGFAYFCFIKTSSA